jgi:glycosyltransferase involved in cell wall biosynthesis
MKIVLVNRHPSDVIGGSEIQSAGIAIRLNALEHEITFVAPAGDAGKNYDTVYKVIPVVSDAEEIAKAVIAQKPDIVYWRFNKYHFHDAVQKIAAHNIPIVFAVSHISDTQPWSYRETMTSGLSSFLKGIKQGVLNVYNHRGFKYIDGVTVNNIEQLNLLSIKKQQLVNNSITNEAIPFSWSRPYVVWVSNIKPAKQPELFVKLAKHFLKKDIDFLMIGRIQHADYEWLKTANEETQNFYYLGPKKLEEVNGIIEKSLFLVHTCKPEGFSSVFLQAWLKAKPTVSYEFDPGGYVTHENLGGVANQDWLSFIKITQAFIEDSDIRERVGKRAYNFAINNFAADKTTKTLESFLRDILEQRTQK